MVTTSALPAAAADLVATVQASRLPKPAERRRIRERAGLSIRAVADALGVSPSAVLKWELGTAIPRRHHAAAYGALLHALDEATR